MDADIVQGEMLEDVGYLYKYLGVLPLEAPVQLGGGVKALTLSNKYGILCCGLSSGVMVARTSTVLSALSMKASSSSMPLQQRLASISLSLIKLRDEQGATALSLSSDELCLAVLTGQGSVLCYSLSTLTNSQAAALLPLSVNMPADTGITHFVWCKGAANTSQISSFLYLTEGRDLYVGKLGAAAPILIASQVFGADWAPDGLSLAYSTEEGVWLVPVLDGVEQLRNDQITAHLSIVTHPDCGGALVVESVSWISDALLLLGGVEVEEDEEHNDAFLMAMQLGGWRPNSRQPPTSVTVFTYIPFMVEGQSCESLSGPYLHTATLRQWDATIISHRKMNDDHIQLIITGGASPGAPSDLPCLVSVSDDKISIRLPNSPDGDDNFVVGLALDTSVDAGCIPHPLNQELPDLPSAPVLWVATSDGMLRAYNFSHLHGAVALNSSSLLQIPNRDPDWLGNAAHDICNGNVSNAYPTGAATASIVGQGSRGQERHESASSGDDGAAEAASAAAAAAAAVSLPSDDFDEENSSEDSDTVVLHSHRHAVPGQSQGSSHAATTQQHAPAQSTHADPAAAAAAAASAVALPSDDDDEDFAENSLVAGPAQTGHDSDTASTATSPPLSVPAAGSNAAQRSQHAHFLLNARLDARQEQNSGHDTSSRAQGPSHPPDQVQRATSAVPAFTLPQGFSNPALKPSATSAASVPPTPGASSGRVATPLRTTPFNFSNPAQTEVTAPSSAAILTGQSPSNQGSGVMATPQALPSNHHRTAPASVIGAPAANARSSGASTKAQQASVAPPRVPTPQRAVPRPTPKLYGMSPEVAAVESEFLESLHESRVLAAQLDEKMDNFLGVGISLAAAQDRGGGSAGLTYHDTADTIQALLAVTQRVAQQDAECRQPSTEGGIGSDLQKLHASLPLDPALEAMRNEIALQRKSIARCVDELSAKLDAWKVAPAGQGLSADSLSQTLAMQATSLSDMTLAVAALEEHMARAGMGARGRQARLLGFNNSLRQTAVGSVTREDSQTTAADLQSIRMLAASSSSPSPMVGSWITPRSATRGASRSPSFGSPAPTSTVASGTPGSRTNPRGIALQAASPSPSPSPQVRRVRVTSAIKQPAAAGGPSSSVIAGRAGSVSPMFVTLAAALEAASPGSVAAAGAVRRTPVPPPPAIVGPPSTRVAAAAAAAPSLNVQPWAVGADIGGASLSSGGSLISSRGGSGMPAFGSGVGGFTNREIASGSRSGGFGGSSVAPAVVEAVPAAQSGRLNSKRSSAAGGFEQQADGRSVFTTSVTSHATAPVVPAVPAAIWGALSQAAPAQPRPALGAVAENASTASNSATLGQRAAESAIHRQQTSLAGLAATARAPVPSQAATGSGQLSGPSTSAAAAAGPSAPSGSHPCDSDSSTGTSRPKRASTSSQPPMPSFDAVRKAQARVLPAAAPKPAAAAATAAPRAVAAAAAPLIQPFPLQPPTLGGFFSSSAGASAATPTLVTAGNVVPAAAAAGGSSSLQVAAGSSTEAESQPANLFASFTLAAGPASAASGSAPAAAGAALSFSGLGAALPPAASVASGGVFGAGSAQQPANLFGTTASGATQAPWPHLQASSSAASTSGFFTSLATPAAPAVSSPFGAPPITASAPAAAATASMFGQATPASAAPLAATLGGMFGQNAAAPVTAAAGGLFGQAATLTMPAAPTPSLGGMSLGGMFGQAAGSGFAAPALPAGGNVFGQTTSSVFGAPAVAASGGVFGQAPSVGAASGGAFGSAGFGQSSSFGFGGGATAAATPASTFGSSGAFGGGMSTFGQPSLGMSGSSAFGGLAAPLAAPAGVFGASSGFGQASGSGFGQTTGFGGGMGGGGFGQHAAGGGGFGALSAPFVPTAPAFGTAGGFGAAAAGGGFGAATTGGGFGVAAAGGGFGAAAGGGFGAAAAGGGFGAAAPGGFGAATGGFGGGAAPASGGFGGLGAGGGSMFGGSPSPAAASGPSALWAPRR